MIIVVIFFFFFFFFKQKTAYEISECDWSSDVCSSDLDCHWTNLAYAAAPAQALREASHAALDRALELAPDLVEARASEAILATMECDWTRADRLYEALLSDNSGYWLAIAYRAMQ